MFCTFALQRNTGFMELSFMKEMSIALSLFSLFVAWKVSRKSGTKIGCLAFGYVSLVVFLIGMFAVVITSVITVKAIENITTYLGGEKCVASVISYSSYDTTDDDGNNIQMYTPTYTLETSNGNRYDVEATYSSGGIPTVGEEVSVYFNEDNQLFVELSATSLIMMCGMFIMWMVLAFAFVGIIMYSFDWNMFSYYKMVQAIGMYFFLPFVMICFEALLIYGFFYGNEVPTFVSGILLFFIVVLGLAILGLLSQLINKGLPKWKQTGAGSWSADWEDEDCNEKKRKLNEKSKKKESNYKRDY